MAVVLREAELAHADDTALREDLQLLRTQVDECKKILLQTLASAGQACDEGSRHIPLDAYLECLLEEWQLIRPQATVAATLAGPRPAPEIATDRRLEQALLNLLDNAADASPEGLAFNAEWSATALTIDILDRGPGIDPATASRLGEAFVSSKADGLGIGFFLTNATLEQFGGSVELTPRDTGGTRTHVTLPLAQLTLDPT